MLFLIVFIKTKFTSDPGVPTVTFVGADTKEASANKSTSSDLLFPLELCVGTDVGASIRSPNENKST